MNNNIYKFNTIETERLILRSLTPEVYKFVFNWFSDEDLKFFFGLQSVKELAREKEKLEQGLFTYNRSFHQFQLIEKTSKMVIGTCGYHTWYLQHHRAELGYALTVESARNKGYMREALFPILSYGFEQMKLHRIEAMSSPENFPSIKLLRGAGFREEGMLREHYFNNDRYEDSAIFSLLKKEWRTHCQRGQVAETLAV